MNEAEPVTLYSYTRVRTTLNGWRLVSTTGATGNRCFKLRNNNRALDRVGGVCTPAFLCGYLQSWKARLDYIECTAAFTIISLPPLPPLIRKHASAPLGISLISSPSAPTSACFYTGGSSYVNEPHRCFSVLNERLGFFFVSHLEKCVFVSTKAAYDRLRFVLRRSVVFLRVNHGTMDVVLGT